MGFRQDGYLNIWEYSPGKGNYIDARANSSKMVNGEREEDFNSYIRLCTTAKTKAEQFPPLDPKQHDYIRIKILSCDATTKNYKKDDGNWDRYHNYAVFDFEVVSMKINGKTSIIKDNDDQKLNSKKDTDDISTTAELEALLNEEDKTKETLFENEKIIDNILNDKELTSLLIKKLKND